MKKLLWTSAMALTAAACMTACDDSSSGASNSIPEFKTEAALPDTCEMEVAKAGDTYFACFENKWIEVTDSATVEQLKEGLDEDEVKAKLEELEDLLKPVTPAKPKSSSSKKTDEDVDSSDSDEPESSASEEECTGRRCKTGNSSSSKKSSGGNGGSGSEEPTSTESSSPSSAESSSPSSAESSSPSSTDSSGDSSPSSTDSSGDSSPSSATSGTSTESASSEEVCRLIKINSYSDGKKLAVIKAVKGNSTYALLEAKLAVEKVPSYVVATMDKSKAEAVVAALKNADSDISLSEETAKECPSLCAGVTHDEANTICDRRTPFPIYRIVKIGTQTWMAENLKYATDNSKCYNDDCSYGRFYSWSDATTNDVCPDGWHLPSENEFQTLVATAGGEASYNRDNTAAPALKSKTDWDGDNTTGFNALPYGDYGLDGNHANFGGAAYFWGSEDDGSGDPPSNANALWMKSDVNKVFVGLAGAKLLASVRCIKDASAE